MRYHNILEAIGCTPLVRLNRIVRDCKGQAYVKCDNLNPGCGVKGRICIVQAHEADRKGRPEIWEDTEGKVTHFVVGMGTGGTITGIGRYLKEKNPAVRIIGVDPVGSILYDYFHQGIISKHETYKTEGIGEDFLPTTL